MEDFQTKNLTDGNYFNNELRQLNNITKSFERKIEVISELSKAKDVIEQLKSKKELALDCEGVRLGRDGKLTVLQIGAYEETIYLFDVLVLGNEIMGELKEIIESESIVKFTYDCRQDSDSIFHEYGIKLSNVLDMQLYEFMIRPKNKELPLGYRPTHYRKPRVRGLGAAIKDYISASKLRSKGLGQFYNIKNAGDQLMRAERTIWRYRPLSAGMINYAALDIEMIWMVAMELQALKHLNGITLERLQIASTIYTKVRRDPHEKPDGVYVNHPVMISYVIPEVGADGGIKPFPRADKKCVGCQRLFPSDFVNRRDLLCNDCTEISRAWKCKSKKRAADGEWL